MISNRTNSKKADPIDSYHHDAGKGSIYRPSNRERFDANWDRIFAKEKNNATTTNTRNENQEESSSSST
jgi:hypothetical protein